MNHLNEVRWGIIGCGDVTERKSGPGLQMANGSSLVAVMRRDANKARAYAQRHGVARWYDDAQQLINDPNVNAVYIATPPDSHRDYTLQVAQAGKPVSVEKPMARSFAECRQMIAACESAGVPLFVAYYRRRLPRFLKVEELLQNGAIGRVRAVLTTLHQKPRTPQADNLPWRLNPQIAGAGIFLDLASHTLDALDYLLGPIEEVGGAASNLGQQYAAEDGLSAHFRFASGVLGVGSWCFSSWQSRDANEIIGERGTILFSTFGTEAVRLQTADGVQEFECDTPPHVQAPLQQTMVDELLGRGECPSTGQSGARTNWVMDEMLRSWRAAYPDQAFNDAPA